MNFQGLYGRQKRIYEEARDLDKAFIILDEKKRNLLLDLNTTQAQSYTIAVNVTRKIARRYEHVENWLNHSHLCLPGTYVVIDLKLQNWIVDIFKRPVEWFIDYENTIFILMAWKYSSLAVLGKDIVRNVICPLILKQ